MWHGREPDRQRRVVARSGELACGAEKAAYDEKIRVDCNRCSDDRRSLVRRGRRRRRRRIHGIDRERGRQPDSWCSEHGEPDRRHAEHDGRQGRVIDITGRWGRERRVWRGRKFGWRWERASGAGGGACDSWRGRGLVGRQGWQPRDDRRKRWHRGSVSIGRKSGHVGSWRRRRGRRWRRSGGLGRCWRSRGRRRRGDGRQWRCGVPQRLRRLRRRPRERL